MPMSEEIVAVRAYLLEGVPGMPGEEDDQAESALGHWKRGKVSSPMARYPDHRDSRPRSIGPDSLQQVLVEVESASGVVGYGTTEGGVASAAIIELHLAAMVEGQPASAHEAIWDRMFRSTIHYGRKGLVMHALSGVDLAVWDLHGRLTETPVYALLGGPVRDSVALYATGPRPEVGQQLGFFGAKLPLTWAPSEGEEGFARNVKALQDARALVGDGYPLMLDCWMSLDVDYAVRLSFVMADLGYQWLEEPLMPDDYAGHAHLRSRMPRSVALAAGEHEYTAAGCEVLLQAGVDLLQPDIRWCGGLTEMRRVAAVLRSSGTRLIPHAGGHYSYHFAMAHPDTPVAEYPITAGDCDQPAAYHLGFDGEQFPVDGHVTMTEAPGFGLTADPGQSLLRPVTRAMLTGHT
jgi:L-rhamnonate dehydratase